MSEEFAHNQSTFDKAGKTFAEDADEGGVAGRGAASQDFAKAYDPVIRDCLALWARSVASVGGVSTGFTVTANNYRAADHASDPKAKGSLPRREPPSVIQRPPHYPEPSSVLFGGSDGDDTDIRDVVGEIGDLEMTVLEAVMDKIKGLTRIADVFPWADADELDGLAETWRTAGTAVKGTGRKCDEATAFITNSKNNEWQRAMRQFGRTLWGASAWGKDQGGFQYGHGGGKGKAAHQPLLEVLDTTATTAASSCETVAEAARTMKRKIGRIIWEAVKATARELLDFDVMEKIDILRNGAAKIVEIFLAKLDQEALDAAVSEYEGALRGLVPQLETRKADLAEAIRSAPTFRAEEARAQAFGARSLNEFKKNPLYTVPNDSADNHKFPVDLANQEGVHGSHVVDKHVGQTDEQLAGRLRDQPKIDAASSFGNLSEAQRYTQDAMEFQGPSDNDPGTVGQPNRGVDNAAKIEKWLSRPRSDDSILRLDPVEYPDVTGRTLEAGNTHARDVHSVSVVLKYRNGIDPPYVVYTSMPKAP